MKLLGVIPLFLAELACSQKITVDVKLQHAARDLLSNFTGPEFFNHGCWCAKLNPANHGQSAKQREKFVFVIICLYDHLHTVHAFSRALGGPDVADELDLICRNWAMARRCSRTSGGACQIVPSNVDFYREHLSKNLDSVSAASRNHISIALYTIDGGVCSDTDECLQETCNIDLDYRQSSRTVLIDWCS